MIENTNAISVLRLTLKLKYFSRDVADSVGCAIPSNKDFLDFGYERQDCMNIYELMSCQILSSRLIETGNGVFNSCANRETRNSSISQR